MQLAPFKECFDMFIALAFCYIPPFIWLYFAYKASKSGSVEKKSTGYPGGYNWIESSKNIPIIRTGQFIIAVLWFVFGSLFFCALLWPDHHDVWFISK